MTSHQAGYALGTIIAIAAIVGGAIAAFLLVKKLIKAVADSAAWKAAVLIIVAFICVWVRVDNGESLGDSEYVNNPPKRYVMDILKSTNGVGAVRAATVNTDKNSLLNERAGGTAAVFFEFEGVNQEDFPKRQNVVEKGTAAGGCVEVFETAEKMRKRARHLSFFPLTAGRYKTVGTVIVRVSAKLSREEQSKLAAEICVRLLGNDTSENIEVSYSNFATEKTATIFVFSLIAVGAALYFTTRHKEQPDKQGDKRNFEELPEKSADKKIGKQEPEPLPVSMPKKVILKHPARRGAKRNIKTPSYDAHLFSNTYIDGLFPAAVEIVLETGQASTSMLQRRLKLGYSRASRLIDEMESNGYVGSFEGSAPRRILISREQWEKIRDAVHYKPPAPPIDTAQIIRDEENWRRARMGLSPIEYELQRIDGMEGHAFEEWCADLLRRSGFSSVKVTPGSGDQGVDITAAKDGLTYAVQCKRYASDLGNTPIQEVVAGKAFYRCNVAAVMTNQHFTSGAKELASVNGVLLWDRETITDMLKQEKQL